MPVFLTLIIFVCIFVAIIYLGHMGFDYFRELYIPKVTKNIYHTQVEKYKQIVEELQSCYNDQQIKEQEKIDMEQELADYMEQHIDEIRI